MQDLDILHLLAIDTSNHNPHPQQIQYAHKYLLCCGCYFLSVRERTDLKAIRSSGNYFYYVKCVTMNNPRWEHRFQSHESGFQFLGNQKSPQIILVNVVSLQQTKALDIHSPVHSARRWAGHPLSEHLSYCARHNPPAQSQNHPLVLLESTNTEEREKSLYFTLITFTLIHTFCHCKS